MPLRSLGNMYFGGAAFGDPVETFRTHAPAGLLDAYDEARQAELGKGLQKQLRSWTPSRRGILDSFQEGLLADQEFRVEQAAREQERLMRDNTLGGLSMKVPTGEIDPSVLAMLAGMNREELAGVTGEYVKPFSVTDGAVRGAWGTPQYQAPLKPVNVGAGSALVNPGTGAPVYTQPTARTQEHRAGVRTETQSAKDQEIARLMSQGLDRVTAERLADGHVRMVTDPVTGRTSVVDMVDGRGNFVQIDRPGQEQGVPAQGPTASVTPGVDVQTLTEITGAARRFANKVSDVIGVGPVSQPTAEAAADMRQWYQLGRLRLASAITDDRRSNMVLEMLDDVFINPDQVFMGGEDTLMKLESLDRSLGQISSEFDQVLGNPYSSSVKDVQSAENRKRMIDSVREDIRVMVEGYGQRGSNVGGALPEAGTVQDGYQFLGGNPADPSRWRKVQ
jgi:hypothetical protein